MKLEVLTEHNQQIFDALVAGVRAHNFEHTGTETSKPLSVISRNEDGSLAGGVAGRTIYRQFLIEVLWVAKDSRGKGLGRALLEIAEREARARGCLAAQPLAGETKFSVLCGC